MTKEIYKSRLAELKADYEKKVVSLQKFYAIKNNPYNVGDIVEDHIGVCKILKIIHITTNVWYGIDEPTVVFEGQELRKSDLTPKVNNAIREVYQENIKKVIKKGEENGN